MSGVLQQAPEAIRSIFSSGYHYRRFDFVIACIVIHVKKSEVIKYPDCSSFLLCGTESPDNRRG